MEKKHQTKCRKKSRPAIPKLKKISGELFSETSANLQSKKISDERTKLNLNKEYKKRN